MNKYVKIAIFIVIDFLLATLSWSVSLVICELTIKEFLITSWYYYIVGLAIMYFFLFAFGIYFFMWRFAGILEIIYLLASFVGILVGNLIISALSDYLPITWAFLQTALMLFLIGASRLAFKFAQYFGLGKSKTTEKMTRVIVIGAGNAGYSLIKELKTSDKINYYPVCVLDDDPNRIGRRINGVKIVGKIDQVKTYAEKYKAEEIIIAIPSVSDKRKKEIIHYCKETSCKIRIIPGMYQFVNGKLSASSVKDVSINDLLGREQIKVNLDEIMGYIERKIVMVTGGGGSIGSELCRQIASHNPAKLIILDIYENNAYDIQQELVRKYANLNLDVIIASVRDKKRIDKIFKEERPDIVFHAAAHKHVPLMERNPGEAVKNNVGGTFNVADTSGRYGVKKFILISTDKAVNPTNVMGASKRICEMIIQAMNKKYDTDYVAVRFGNVLGSNGSVIPLFKKQIEEGGPVTVTHKDIVRFFMTIPEAVSLVLQAGAYATGGEIFVLDMGEQVRIYDLAINMIKLSGLEPFKDIDVVITGLRPGEKLYEERLMEEEGLKKTDNELISIGKPLEFDEDKLFENITALTDAAKKEYGDIREKVKELVPTYNIDYGTARAEFNKK